MSQYSTGLSSVTNNSPTVTGTNTLWLANVTAGDSFTVAGDGVMYDVASVDSDTQVTLSVPYAGTTASGVVYAIGTGFTVPDSFPEMSQGDIETATVFTRAMRKIQSKFTGLVSDISTNTSDIADNTANNNRAALLAKATLSADFVNNKYEVYEGVVDGMTQMPFNEALDFTRASAATARTATGKIQEVLTDEQRLVGNREGLLIEEARTNLLLNSDTLSTQNITVTAVPCTIHFTGTGTITLSGTFTGSLVGTGTGEANRVSLTFTPTAGTLTATVTGSVVNAQLEQGSLPTSYIPTAGTQVTRAADNCVRVLGDEFNPKSCTIYFRGTVTDAVGYVFSISGFRCRRNSGVNFMILGADNTLVSSATVPLKDEFLFAFTYDSTSSTMTLVINGVAASATQTTDLNNFLSVGSFNGVQAANGIIKDFRIFPTALSEAELITLTGGT